MASCSRRPSVAGRTCSRMFRINPARSCIGSMEGLPSPRAEKPRKWRASSASIPWGAPSHSPCARGSNGQLQESPAFREKQRFLPCSVQSQNLRETSVRVTNVVPREGSRCIGGANLSLLGSINRHAVGSKAQETRESERDTHTVGTPEVPSTYMSGRKQYPQPVVPCVNYVP